MDNCLNMHEFLYPLIKCKIDIDDEIIEIYKDHVDTESDHAVAANILYQYLLEEIGIFRYIFVWQRQTIRIVHNKLIGKKVGQEEEKMEKLLDIHNKLMYKEGTIDFVKVQNGVNRTKGCRLSTKPLIPKSELPEVHEKIGKLLLQLQEDIIETTSEKDVLKCMEDVMQKWYPRAPKRRLSEEKKTLVKELTHQLMTDVCSINLFEISQLRRKLKENVEEDERRNEPIVGEDEGNKKDDEGKGPSASMSQKQ